MPEPIEVLPEALAGLRPRARPAGLLTVRPEAQLPAADPGFKSALAAMRAGRWDAALRSAGAPVRRRMT